MKVSKKTFDLNLKKASLPHMRLDDTESILQR